MTEEYLQYDLMRRRIESRYSRRRWLVNHIGAFLIINAVIWSQVLFSSYPWYGSSILDRVIFTAAWLGFVILHAINYRTSEQQDRAIQQEIERLSMYPKTKRLSIAEDGELVDHDDAWDENEHLKSRGNI